MRRRQGKIIVPKGMLVEPHELVTATALSWTGHDVEFISERNIHTPDIMFCNKEWEMKSPKGNSSRTIENNMREALRQSKNIIIDLHRIKLPEQKCVATVKSRAAKLGHIRNVIVVTKTDKVIIL